MIDHVGLHVRDYQVSKHFYQQALAPLGYRLLIEIEDAAAGFGVDDKPSFWIGRGDAAAPAHVAFVGLTSEVVDEFHAAALAAGGTDHGAPGLRPHYHPDYYAAFVLDPDGNNIEVVCHYGAQ